MILDMPRETGMRCLVSPRHSGLMQIMQGSNLQMEQRRANTRCLLKHFFEDFTLGRNYIDSNPELCDHEEAENYTWA